MLSISRRAFLRFARFVLSKDRTATSYSLRSRVLAEETATQESQRHSKTSNPSHGPPPRGRNKLQAFRRDVFGRSPLRIAVALCSSEGGRIAFHKEGRVRRRTTPPSTVVNTSTVLLGPEPFVGQAGPNPHPTVLPTSAGSPRKPKFSGRR